jgi:hypothetical protein
LAVGVAGVPAHVPRGYDDDCSRRIRATAARVRHPGLRQVLHDWAGRHGLTQPDAAQSELQSRWRALRPAGVTCVPFFRLLAALPPWGLDPHGRATFAVFWPGTQGIDFAAPLVAGRRAGAVEALVAHELGHAYAQARQLSPNGEELANGLMRRWGFSPEDLPAGP